MTQINPKLLERLESALGIGRNRLNRRISERASSDRVERTTAALLIAADYGISISRFSTPEERATMRNAAGSHLPPVFVPPVQSYKSSTTKPSAKRVVSAKATEENTVFVVHGRDTALNESLFAFLRSIGLKPIEFEKAILMAKGNNPHLQEILNAAMTRAQAVVVLLSPDDEAMLSQRLWGKRESRDEKTLKGQPRQNVLFEAGLAIGGHEKKTVLVQVGMLRVVSDILGRHIPRLSNAPEKRNDLINRLERIGCKVDRIGTQWMSEGNFVPSNLAGSTRVYRP